MSKKRKNKNLNFRVVSQGGIPCPRCYVPTELRERTQVTDKQLTQPYYFSRWYNCNNDECPTTLIMREEFKIMNDPKAAASHRRLGAIRTQLAAPTDAVLPLSGRAPHLGEPPPWEE